MNTNIEKYDRNYFFVAFDNFYLYNRFKNILNYKDFLFKVILILMKKVVRIILDPNKDKDEKLNDDFFDRNDKKEKKEKKKN